MRTLLRFLAGWPRGLLLVAAAFSLVLFAVLDYLTGTAIRFFIFYWPLIAVVVWFVGIRWGYAYVFLTAAAWFIANGADTIAEQGIPVTLWNTAANFISFLFLAYVLGYIHAVLSRERDTARTDFVTGVPNSRSFGETLGRSVTLSRRTGRSLSLAYLDLDDFKAVNDSFGHSRGDDLLREVAQAISRAVRASDVVARVGGDEFAVLFPDTGMDEALQAVDRIRASVRRLAAFADLPISVSVGLLTCDGKGCSADELMHRADTLMYEVKAAGKDGVRALPSSSKR